MASKPAYLHGRGRGRGNAGVGRASPQPNSGRPGAPKGPDGRLGGVSSPQRVAYSKVTGRQSVTDIGDGLNMNNGNYIYGFSSLLLACPVYSGQSPSSSVLPCLLSRLLLAPNFSRLLFPP